MSATLMDMAADLMPARWGLRAFEKFVLEQLGRMADNETDDCFPGLPYIAKRTDLSVDTVRRCIRSLSEGGWLAVIPRERANGATTSHIYQLNAAQITQAWVTQRAEEKAAKMAAPPSTQPPAPPSTQLGGPLLPARGNITDININNSLSGAPAREDWKAFEAEVTEAAGDAPDPTAPGILAVYPLMALLSVEPACTMTEITQGVRKAAGWYADRNLKHKMRNWDMAVKMALEFRDMRLAGHPVKEPAKATPAASEADVSAWSIERWRGAVRAVKNRGGGVWPPGWGPEPGAEGSAAPPEIVELWKGVTA
ncbi:helix-turn-helix domain-containing protein [Asticcacaulis sp.]|uniref:helix-turn-helix domain-containing protein n=1 Tax=Asticcacaulis sp. TaxID=1872648 RepID=UPI003F7B937D